MIDPPPDEPQADRQRPASDASRRWPWALVAAQAVLVAALAAWLLSGRPIGIPGQWAWQVREKTVSGQALFRAIVFGAAIIGLCWLGVRRIRARRRSDALVIAGLVLLAFAFQLAVASLAPQAGFLLIASTGSAVSTEYFGTARGINDPWAYCRRYVVSMRQGHHVGTHPPGAVLAYYACLRLYHSHVFPGEAFARMTEWLVVAPREAVAQAASSLPETLLKPRDVGPALFCCLFFGACAALTIVPLYYIARRATRRSTALIACSLFALTPGVVLFFQGLDALVLLLSTTALAFAYTAITRPATWAGLACGLTLGLACFITFGAMGAIAIIIGMACLLTLRAPLAHRRQIGEAIVAGAGTWLLVMLVGHLVCDSKLHVIFRQAMSAHREFTWEGFQRSYGTWVVLNMVEFSVFLGVPTLVGVVAAAGVTRCGWRRMTRGDVIGLAGALVLLLLNFSGGVRGEVGRVWLFMMPPLVLWAAHSLSTRPTGRRGLTLFSAVLALAQVLLCGLMLTPVATPY